MITVNKVQVPINAEQDNNKNKTTWLNGKYVSLDEGPAVTLFIGHTKETVIEADGREMEIALAFPVRVVKPVKIVREKMSLILLFSNSTCGIFLYLRRFSRTRS